LVCLQDGYPESPAPDHVDGVTYVWGTDINVHECERQFKRFMKEFKDSPEDPHSKYGRILEEVRQCWRCSKICVLVWDQICSAEQSSEERL
jgi:hypothetical protein